MVTTSNCCRAWVDPHRNEIDLGNQKVSNQNIQEGLQQQESEELIGSVPEPGCNRSLNRRENPVLPQVFQFI